jgi:predicted peptidase
MIRRLLLALCFLIAAAFGKVIDQNANIAGMPLNYKVVLPKDYDPEKAYPAVLAFPPGGQTSDMVFVTLSRNWAPEAQKRGYIVVIPAAPLGKLFMQDGAKVFPEFLEKLLADYKIRDRKFHIAGMSNGGISAFHIAASYPQYFRGVTGFPGFLPDATPARVNALAQMCLYLHVGELDTDWRQSMQEQAAAFRAKGFTVRMTVEKGESHVIGALTGDGAARLFEEIEACGK